MEKGKTEESKGEKKSLVELSSEAVPQWTAKVYRSSTSGWETNPMSSGYRADRKEEKTCVTPPEVNEYIRQRLAEDQDIERFSKKLASLALDKDVAGGEVPIDPDISSSDEEKQEEEEEEQDPGDEEENDWFWEARDAKTREMVHKRFQFLFQKSSSVPAASPPASDKKPSTSPNTETTGERVEMDGRLPLEVQLPTRSDPPTKEEEEEEDFYPSDEDSFGSEDDMAPSTSTVRKEEEKVSEGKEERNIESVEKKKKDRSMAEWPTRETSSHSREKESHDPFYERSVHRHPPLLVSDRLHRGNESFLNLLPSGTVEEASQENLVKWLKNREKT